MDPEQALRSLMEGWERGDPDAVADLFSDDGSYVDPLLEGIPVGPSAIREALVPSMRSIEDCSVPIRTLVSTGSIGFCEGTFRSHLAGAPTRFDFDFAAVVDVRDGKIARLTEYFDTSPLPS